MAAGGIGGFLGDMLQQQSDATRKPYTGFLDALLPNPGRALQQGAIQAGMTGALGTVGKGAAKLGFPKIAALFGAGTPRSAVANAAPQAAKAVSAPGLQAVDAAAQVSPQAAVQRASAGATQAAGSIPWAANMAPQATPGLSGNAQGLSAIANMGIPQSAIPWLARITGQQAPGVAPVAMRGGQRAAQTAAALLGNQAIRPMSNSPALPALGDLLKMLAQNRSQ
jgi:hypothetical protein